MPDKQIHLDDSVLQYGPESDRIYLMKFHPERREELYTDIMALAEQKNYGKIFIKIPEVHEDFFRVRGFLREAVVPGFFGNVDGLFMARYLKKERAEVPENQNRRIHEVLEAAKAPEEKIKSTVGSAGSIRLLMEEDVPAMAAIYRQVFESYPFPVHDPAFLKKNMNESVYYFGTFKDGNLVGLSSAECDPETRTAEMTDFAVLPQSRGEGTALKMLNVMEQFIADKGYSVAYTIARAVSFGMNKTFAKASYTYGGTLTNNTQISGSIESMNVWHKSL